MWSCSSVRSLSCTVLCATWASAASVPLQTLPSDYSKLRRLTECCVQVSWVRRRDWHIISSGMLMYTNDERFQVLHSEGSDDWILQIKYVQKRDNGTYECQALYCSSSGCMRQSPVPPQYVFWYHNARMINYDAARGVTVLTEPGPKTQSALAIRSAGPQHSGNYTCCAANTEPAHIFVYVTQGSDTMAATLSRSKARAPPAAPPPARAPLLLALAALSRAAATPP
ncbi:hypothetical protein HF086_001153 [Spodoptera exigua]|uniref:Ig-like domain-containing protein n=1 Tax=Spodoptera exigua TaxID=7107 RepID=A0A922S857_SPOEX|nr:hypothetical protein HF086_001153 [Spodoptera exigua]